MTGHRALGLTPDIGAAPDGSRSAGGHPPSAPVTAATLGVAQHDPAAASATGAAGATGAGDGAAAAADARAAWAAEPERSSLPALKVMVWIALRCGRRLARAVLVVVVFYFVLFSPRQRRASRRYLDRALGREASWWDGYRHVFCFAATVLDRVYLLRGQTTWLDLHAQGTRMMDARVALGKGVYMMGAHLGSFEVLRATGLGANAPGKPAVDITMLMYPDNARMINSVLAAIAPEARPRIIALGRPEAMLAVRDRLAAGGLVGVLADRTLPLESDRSGVMWLPFLGRPAPFSDGPFRLAELLRQPVIFMAGLYCGGGRYEVHFEQLADFSQRLRDPAEREARLAQAMAAYVARLESLCRARPYNWFNFHDFWHEDAGPNPPG